MTPTPEQCNAAMAWFRALTPNQREEHWAQSGHPDYARWLVSPGTIVKYWMENIDGQR
jgi:hypothetical protein